MMHIFINAVGASAGGGLTYLRNVVPHLARINVRTTTAVNANIDFPEFAGVQIIRCLPNGGVIRRFWFEQTELPKRIRKSGADVLVSAGNFALRRSPVPQILLSRNSLYTSKDFSRDLIHRREYGMWIDTRLKAYFAKKSVSWADRTVAPSAAFAHEVQRWSGAPVDCIHHGFDREQFCRPGDAPPEAVRDKLRTPAGILRVLLVSHYNYYRNFETVFRGLARLVHGLAVPCRLFLTCELERAKTPGAYDPVSAAKLIESLGLREHVVQLGSVPYQQLYQIYGACDVFVSAAYTETFAHPLVEAMASGVPVVASDLPVHREICGDAARYFPSFSAEHLAVEIGRLAGDAHLRGALAEKGLARSLQFSWKAHVAGIVALAGELAGRQRPQAESSAAAGAA
jgi:glycosyltransferase involved in cell wall biosynthesis